MEPEILRPLQGTQTTEADAQAAVPSELPAAEHEPPWPEPEEYRGLRWIFIGDGGLRAGWSVAISVFLYRLFAPVLGTAAVELFPSLTKLDFSPTTALIGELVSLLALLAAVAIVARIDHRTIFSYNLAGPRRSLHFISGVAAGFAALSALVGALAWGGWLRFGPAALSGTHILTFALLWGVAFLLVGLFEEGAFRCYLQFTLTRGINFWWALGIVAFFCVDLALRSHGNGGVLVFIWLDTLPMLKGNGSWGVYIIAALGLIPCALLYLNKTPGSNFWQAAWVTSTIFGFIHTGNHGENWIGIFAAAAIGFVFCVSVCATGSAWWAIGCHAAWDWSETYFYGAADSGNVATGHYLTTTPAGAAFWSGGADGPEGSVLVIAIVLLLLLAILVLYGHGKRAALSSPVAEVTSA